MNPDEAIGRVADALNALGLDDVVFVEGPVVGLLPTDPPGRRPQPLTRFIHECPSGRRFLVSGLGFRSWFAAGSV
ncbi:MAG: hypothetical protein O3A02_03790 [bacterium]|nr:hypothetical protein [bacterium]